MPCEKDYERFKLQILKLNGTVAPITNGTPEPVDAAEAIGEPAKQQEINVTNINAASATVGGDIRPRIEQPVTAWTVPSLQTAQPKPSALLVDLHIDETAAAESNHRMSLSNGEETKPSGLLGGKETLTASINGTKSTALAPKAIPFTPGHASHQSIPSASSALPVKQKDAEYLTPSSSKPLTDASMLRQTDWTYTTNTKLEDRSLSATHANGSRSHSFAAKASDPISTPVKAITNMPASTHPVVQAGVNGVQQNGATPQSSRAPDANSSKASKHTAKGKSMILHIQVPELYKPKTGQDRPDLPLGMLRLLLRKKPASEGPGPMTDKPDEKDVLMLVSSLVTQLDSLKAGQALIKAEQSQFKADQSQFKAEHSQLKAEHFQFKAAQSQFEAEQTQIKATQSQLQAEQSQLKAEQSQLDGLVSQITQAEERRKFLGTSSARIPFIVKVNAVTKVVNIQIDAALTVTEVIRRTRFAADLLPCHSPNPRLAVDGTEVGHLTLVHEAGISSASQLELRVGEEEEKH